MKTFYTALAALAIALGTAGTAMADDITADVLTYDGNTKVVTAKGDVVIHATRGPPLPEPMENTISKTEAPSWKAASTM